jgi:hypothetical protein
MQAHKLRAQRTPTLRIGVMMMSVLALATAACGTSGSGSGSGAACAAATPGRYLADAHVALIGTMLPGQTVKLGSRHVLLSPARVHVVRYLKGTGPATVTVTTEVSSSNAVGSEGIDPQPGERWQIYSTSKAMPFDTSDCSGSKQLTQ